MFKRLKGIFKRFEKDKNLSINTEEISKTMELSRKKKYRELTSTEVETIISLLDNDPEKLIRENFVKVDWDLEEIVDLTGESVKADARLVILAKKRSSEYKKSMRAKSLENLKSKTNPLERIENKPLEKIFKKRNANEAKSELASNPFAHERIILTQFLNEIEKHFRKKVGHY